MLKLDHISYAYDGGQSILKDISFALPQGEHLAVMGAAESYLWAYRCAGEYILLRKPRVGAFASVSTRLCHNEVFSPRFWLRPLSHCG